MAPPYYDQRAVFASLRSLFSHSQVALDRLGRVRRNAPYLFAVQLLSVNRISDDTQFVSVIGCGAHLHAGQQFNCLRGYLIQNRNWLIYRNLAGNELALIVLAYTRRCRNDGSFFFVISSQRRGRAAAFSVACLRMLSPVLCRLFLSPAVLDRRVGCTADDLSPLFSVTCSSDRTFHGFNIFHLVHLWRRLPRAPDLGNVPSLLLLLLFVQ